MIALLGIDRYPIAANHAVLRIANAHAIDASIIDRAGLSVIARVTVIREGASCLWIARSVGTNVTVIAGVVVGRARHANAAATLVTQGTGHPVTARCGVVGVRTRARAVAEIVGAKVTIIRARRGRRATVRLPS